MTQKAEQKEPTESNTFECALCNAQAMPFGQDTLEHLKVVHSYTDETLKELKKQMQSHLDGRDWYQTNYMIYDGSTIVGYQAVWNKRDRDDPMRFDD